MHALVYGGGGHKDWTTAPDPSVVDPTDAIIRVDAVTICGTDLHILKGDVPAVTPGRILGHEAVGTVVEAGAAVTTIRPGDRVLASCISGCGRCRYCRTALRTMRRRRRLDPGPPDRRRAGQYARIPFADMSPTRCPTASPTNRP